MNPSWIILPFFQYDSQMYTDYFCIFWFITVYHRLHVKDRWILPESLCARSGQLVHVFMWRHALLQTVFPNIVQYVQFSCVIDVNCMIYTICTFLVYSCFVFFWHLCYVYCFKQLFMYFMWMYWYISTWQIIMQEICIDIDIFHDVVTFIWIFWFLMRIVLHIVYFYISCTVTLHLSYFRHINFQQ